MPSKTVQASRPLRACLWCTPRFVEGFADLLAGHRDHRRRTHSHRCSPRADGSAPPRPRRRCWRGWFRRRGWRPACRPQLGDGGDEMMTAGGDVVRRGDLVPLDADDAIHLGTRKPRVRLLYSVTIIDSPRGSPGAEMPITAPAQAPGSRCRAGDQAFHASRHVGRLW